MWQSCSRPKNLSVRLLTACGHCRKPTGGELSAAAWAGASPGGFLPNRAPSKAGISPRGSQKGPQPSSVNQAWVWEGFALSSLPAKPAANLPLTWAGLVSTRPISPLPQVPSAAPSPRSAGQASRFRTESGAVPLRAALSAVISCQWKKWH